MLIALVFLTILSIIFLVLALTKSYHFRYIAKLSEEESKENITQLAFSLRSPKEVGAAPKTLSIRKSLSDSYNIICKKVKENKELYELERWLYENYHTVMSKFNARTYKHMALLPHNGQNARVTHIADYVLSVNNYALDMGAIKESILTFNATTPLLSDEIFALKQAFNYSIVKKIKELTHGITEYYNMENSAKYSKLKKRNTKYLSYLYYLEQNNRSINTDEIKKYNDINVDNVRYLFQTDLLYRANLIANCVKSLHFIDRELSLNLELSINHSNILMCTDNNYKIMDNDSKVIYLKAIEKLASNLGVNEKKIISTAFMLSQRFETHFGVFFFENRRILKHFIQTGEIKEYSHIKKYMQYLFALINYGASVIVGVFVGFMFMRNPILAVSFAILSAVASFPIAENLCIRFYKLFTHKRPMPRLDYKCLPSSAKTLVIMPVFVGNVGMANSVINNIIDIRESNRGENITFALLVDFAPSKKLEIDDDKEIIEKFEQTLSAYSDINVFVRKRTKVNGKFQAYEKKRGAIIDLNECLITCNKSRFAYIMRSNYFVPEFVVTLDEDNKLLPNTIVSAVNTMLHPLNSKYDLLTFSPKYNIFSLNTTYSKQFYYSSGFDRYDGEDNFYFDLCGKSIYSGKGIYRLMTFHKKLHNVLPENAVLSHDIIEGALVNTGALRQSVFEDAPTTFVSDSVRQNRWFKGDLLLARFIPNTFKNVHGKRVRNKKEPIYNYVMCSNILRGFATIALFALLVTALALQNPWAIAWTLILNLIVPLANILTTMNGLSYNIRYIYVFKSLGALILNTLYTIITLPFYAMNNVIVVLKTIYCVAFDKANILKWKTFASMQKDNNLSSYLILIAPSLVMMLIFSLIFISNLWIIGYSAIFTAVMLCLHVVNIKIESQPVIHEDEKKFLIDNAKRIYKYFIDAKSVNGLVADNIQIKPYKGKSKTTSPTNIGFSLLAEVSAFELGIITLDEAEINIKKHLDIIMKLPKVRGNLYNWYDAESCEVVRPRYVSSVDEGNFLASILTTREFLRKYSLYGITACDTIIADTDLAYLYDEYAQMFYIGYNEDKNLFEGHYDILASESRILYYIYSAYYCNPLGFLNTKRDNIGVSGNVLLSWSGTMFEYLMAKIFINSPKQSLIGSSEINCVKVQRKRKCNYLWGISESGYNKFDANLNYQYYAFGINELALRNSSDKCVISPYSTFLALQVDYINAYKNLHCLQRNDMLGEYGFYEAVDYTKNKKIIYSYMSHHQGMSLCALANVLSDNVISELFMSNKKLNSNKMLLSERKLITKSYVKPKQDYVYAPKIEYSGYMLENEEYPAMGTLTNGKYQVVYDYIGNNYSKMNDDFISRFRYDKRSNYGLQSYVEWQNNSLNITKEDSENTNTVTKSYYSAGNSRNSTEYCYKFTPFDITFTNRETKQTEEIYLPYCMNGEVHRFRIPNNSSMEQQVKAITHMPITLESFEADISHPCFADLFVESKSYKNGMIYSRKERNGKINKFLGVLVCGDGEVRYNSNKDKCLERLSGEIKPIKDYLGADNKGINNYFCAESSISIPPNSTAEVVLSIIYTEREEEIINFFNSVDTKHVEYMINTAKVKSLNALNFNAITTNDYALQSNLLHNIFYAPYKESSARLLLDEGYRGYLKSIGVDLNRKILVFDYNNNNNALNIYHKIFNYLSIFTQKFVVIIQYRESNEYYQGVKNVIKSIIANAKYKAIITEYCSDYPLKNLSLLELTPYVKESIINGFPINVEENLSQSDVIALGNNYDLATGSGGMINKGYIVDKPTFAPYSNVICMENGGSVISENGGGFSYFGNSRNNKITAWYNDPLLDKSSESIYYNANDKLIRINKRQNGGIVKHLLGKSVFVNSINGVKLELSEFMILNGDAKVYAIDNSSTKGDYIMHFDFSLNYKRQQSMLYYELLDNVVRVTNIASLQQIVIKVINGKISPFTGKIDANDLVSKLWKIERINKDTNYAVNTDKIYIVIGKRLETIQNINCSNIDIEMNKSLEYFNSLNKIKITTNNQSLDYLFNDWLLYQTVSARINGKCGYYQVGGAIGFRDQLQDCLAMLYSDTKYVKSHILECSKRQFIEGDVLHWWHNPAIGVRTRISDDKLFLPYLVAEYIKTTGDTSILTEEMQYVVGEVLGRHEEDRYRDYQFSEIKAPIYEHCLKAFDSALKFGQHGLLLIGSGDWNDALNAIGDDDKGESVWLTIFAYYVIRQFLKYIKDDKRKYYEDILVKLQAGANNAFDGAWYKRAITKDGEWLGSSESKVCKIDLICQSFAVISQISEYNRLKLALASCDRLVDSNNMLVKLLSPPFNKDKYFGYISAYPEGVRENGGQYTHAVAWYIKALGQISPNKAYATLNMINPININKINAKKYRNEPYVLSADVYTNGNAGWSWYTGSSSWLYKVILEDIIGVEIASNMLIIKPKRIEELLNYRIEYRYQNAIFDIAVSKTTENSITINGEKTLIDRFEIDLVKYNGIVNIQINYKIN